MKTVEHMECIHGLIYQTCRACKDKSEAEIHAEIVSFGDGSKKTKVKLEYQQILPPDLDEAELDIAYDFEETSDY